MKNYININNFDEPTHTIRVTFQTGEYKGHIAYFMGGNCFGLDVIDFDPDIIDQDEIDKYAENDCHFAMDEDMDMFSMVLKNDAGDELDCECDACELRDYVVALEIINCE